MGRQKVEVEVISGLASLSLPLLSSGSDLPVVKHWSSCCGLKINNIPAVPPEAAGGLVLFNISLALPWSRRPVFLQYLLQHTQQ